MLLSGAWNPRIGGCPTAHVNLGSLVPVVDTKADGTIYIRAGEPLEPYPRLLTDVARATPSWRPRVSS